MEFSAPTYNRFLGPPCMICYTVFHHFQAFLTVSHPKTRSGFASATAALYFLVSFAHLRIGFLERNMRSSFSTNKFRR